MDSSMVALATAPCSASPPAGPQLSAFLADLRVSDLRAILRAASAAAGTSSLKKAQLVDRVAGLIDVRQQHPGHVREGTARLIHAAHAMRTEGADPYNGVASAILTAAGGGGSGSGSGGGAGAAAATPPGLARAHAPAGPGPGPPSAAARTPPSGAPAPPASARPHPSVAASAAAAARAAGGDAATTTARTTIRCICGLSADRGAMVQCGGAGCGVWQHAACVAPHGVQGTHLCELCRLQDADPFSVPASPADLPGLASCSGPEVVRLDARGAPALLPPGADPGSMLITADRTFSISPPALAALRAATADSGPRLQLAVLGVGDGPAWPGAAVGGYGGGPGPGGGGAPGRVMWPRFVDVRVNNAAVPPPVRRQPHEPLGSRGRDPAVDVPADRLRAGANRLYVGAIEPPRRGFVLVARLAVRVSLDALRSSPPPDEGLAASVDRVCAAVAGDDPDLVVDSATVSLRCPLSGARLATPVRLGGPGGGLVAFDYGSYLDLAARSRRWVCPHSMRPAPLRLLVRDSYLTAVLASLASRPGVTDIEVRRDGRWRPAGCEADEPWQSVLDEGAAQPAAANGGSRKRSAADAGGEAGAGATPAGPPPGPPVKVEAGPPPPAAVPPPPAGEDVVIVLSSDSESEEDVPLAARAAARAAPTPRRGDAPPRPPTSVTAVPLVPVPPAPPAPPIRVALPPRARPSIDAAAAAAAAAAEHRAREGAATQRLLASFISAFVLDSPPPRGDAVAAAAADLVAAGHAPDRAAAMAGRAYDAAADQLRAGSGSGASRPSQPSQQQQQPAAAGPGETPPAERAAAAAAAAAARATLAADPAALARVVAMATNAAAVRAGLHGGSGGSGV